MPRTHASFFKLLSSRTRVAILKLLRESDNLTVDDLASRLEVTAPTISRHLQLMQVQDLVTFRQEAQTRYYKVNEQEITERIAGFLKELQMELTDE